MSITLNTELNEVLSTLGDNIREKTGGTSLLTLSNMVTEVLNISAQPKLLGISEFESGSFTPTSNATNYTINHSMSQVPNFFIFYNMSGNLGEGYYSSLKIVPYTSSKSYCIMNSYNYDMSYTTATPPSALYLTPQNTNITNSGYFTSTYIKIPSRYLYKLTRYTDDSDTIVDGNGTNTAYKWCRGTSSNVSTPKLKSGVTYYWIAGVLES